MATRSSAAMPFPSRIVVLGAGAIGTLYAAKLSARHAVVLVTRRDAQAEAIRIGGVHVTGLEALDCRIDAVSHLDAIDADTLVILTTKVHDSAGAVGPIAGLVRPDTIVLCIQNGLHSEAIVKGVLDGRCEVLRAITQFGAIHAGAGAIELKARGYTSIEPGPRSQAVADLLTHSGLDGRVSDDIQRDVWQKLVFNCAINPLTAITGMEVGWVADERLDPLKRLIIEECLAVAQKEGVVIDGDLVRVLNEIYRPSRNLSSMHQDLRNGRKTEIDFMNGAVVDLGRRHGVSCPVNASLVALVKAMEATPPVR